MEHKVKELDHRIPFRSQYIEFLGEFVRESDRACVILGVAKLDHLLYRLLTASLRPVEKAKDPLFGTYGPLGSFSARIDFAYRMGLIDAPLARALNLIREIRNSFAHETTGADLNVGAHKDRVAELVAPLRCFPIFEHFAASLEIPAKGAARDFRTALGIVGARIVAAIEAASPPVLTRAMPLVPPNWVERTPVLPSKREG